MNIRDYFKPKLKPKSNKFGFERGTPIDRIYIECFLEKESHHIAGNICEVAEDTYAKKFSNKNKNNTIHILHFTEDNRNATIIGDLTKIETLPDSTMNCLIITQTLNFIYDVKAAIKGIHHMLAKEGIALVTVAGICQISRYDMDRWGDYWRFTDLSIKKLFCEYFDSEKIEVNTYGNVHSANCFLQGMAAEELTDKELFYNDPNYQIIITVKVVK